MGIHIPSTLEQWLDHGMTTLELQLIHCVYHLTDNTLNIKVATKVTQDYMEQSMNYQMDLLWIIVIIVMYHVLCVRFMAVLTRL